MGWVSEETHPVVSLDRINGDQSSYEQEQSAASFLPLDRHNSGDIRDGDKAILSPQPTHKDTCGGEKARGEGWERAFKPSHVQPCPATPSHAQPRPSMPSYAQPCPAQPSPAITNPDQTRSAMHSHNQPSHNQPSPDQPRPAMHSHAQPSHVQL